MNISWTTKAKFALVFETEQEAEEVARKFRGSSLYVGSVGGWVVYNETGSRMMTDRSYRLV